MYFYLDKLELSTLLGCVGVSNSFAEIRVLESLGMLASCTLVIFIPSYLDCAQPLAALISNHLANKVPLILRNTR